MSRSHYTGPVAVAIRASLLLVGVMGLPGCSMSMLGGEEPATTGSIAAPVEVQKPLPQGLAYSDASKIGQAAAAALWQADGGTGEWINASTGSSGTLEGGQAAAKTADASGCRDFNTTVTSIGGVHRYSGQICREGTGRSTLRIDAPA